MTLTERLRALLDERGVEHYDGAERTLWGKDASGYRFSADELTIGSMSVHMWCDTPEQAIAATLGAGTCHDTGESRIFHCSECDLGLDDVFIDDEERYSFADFPRFCPNCGRKVVSK